MFSLLRVPRTGIAYSKTIIFCIISDSHTGSFQYSVDVAFDLCSIFMEVVFFTEKRKKQQIYFVIGLGGLVRAGEAPNSSNTPFSLSEQIFLALK